MGKHRWTYEEDLICCQKYLEYTANYNGTESFADIVKQISPSVPNIEERSLRMKLSNINRIKKLLLK